jgi:hypothetical protein
MAAVHSRSSAAATGEGSASSASRIAKPGPRTPIPVARAVSSTLRKAGPPGDANASAGENSSTPPRAKRASNRGSRDDGRVVWQCQVPPTHPGAGSPGVRVRPTVSVTAETTAAATRAATPHQTPEMLSSQPIARSSENRPGPVAASETATVK